MPDNNPITQRYYPNLADLVDEKKVPAFLRTFLFGDSAASPPVVGALSKIHYRNLQFTKSSNGDSASYISSKFIDGGKVGNFLGTEVMLKGVIPKNSSSIMITKLDLVP